MKHSVIFFSILCLCLLSRSFAYACQPTVNWTHLEEFKKAKAVFIGRALEITPLRQDEYSVKFEVERRFKGAKEAEITVWVDSPPSCSNFDFEKGKSYLVYALGKDLFTQTIFNRSRPMGFENAENSKEMRQLNSSWFRFLSYVPFLK